jgi:Domain of unknown function DUF1828
MNCDKFETLIGMRCNPVGSAVEIITPFTFSDGDGIEVFAQDHGPQVHFFDDGYTLFHLNGAGIHLNDRKRWKPLRAIADLHGVSLSDDGVFETLCPTDNAGHGFARLVSTLMGVAAWAREQTGIAQDSAWFVEEVAMYLKAWKPSAVILEKPTVKGFSGRSLRFNFQIDNQFIDAMQPHGASTGSELRKIVDLNTGAAYTHNDVLVIVDDRTSPDAAKQEIDIIGRVAKAWPMTALISASGAAKTIQ